MTLTHALLPGSPAYNAGDMADTFNDQTGNAVFDTRRDIGAFESQTNLLSIASFNGSVTSIYPNPANSGFVNIRLTENTTSTVMGSIFEIGSGKQVTQFQINGSESQISLDTLATGVYIIQLVSDEFTENHKLVIGR